MEQGEVKLFREMINKLKVRNNEMQSLSRISPVNRKLETVVVEKSSVMNEKWKARNNGQVRDVKYSRRYRC